MKRLFIILLAAVLLAPTVSMAATCRKKAGFTAKYDNRKRACVYANKFKKFAYRDSFDGTPSYGLKLKSETIVRSGNLARRPYLYLRCTDGVLDTYVAFDVVMSCGSEFYDLRFDNYEPFSGSFEPSDSCTTMFLEDTFFSDNVFSAFLEGSKMLRIRATPYASYSQTIKFDVAGFDAAKKPLLVRCPYSIESSEPE